MNNLEKIQRFIEKNLTETISNNTFAEVENYIREMLSDEQSRADRLLVHMEIWKLSAGAASKVDSTGKAYRASVKKSLEALLGLVKSMFQAKKEEGVAKKIRFLVSPFKSILEWFLGLVAVIVRMFRP